jgi:inner membrane protein
VDNVTHTLVGLLVGETAATLAPAKPGGVQPRDKRTALLSMLLIGSNLPDLDFVYARITGNPLDYLLHHRGHTHTFIGALAIAALMLVLCELWLRHRQQRPSKQDRWQLALIAFLAPLLHIALDFTNSYGVHPFWPFWNGWLYGDAVFIVEPLLWSVAAPLVFLLNTLAARLLLAVTLCAGVALAFFTDLVPWPLATLLLTMTLVLLAIGRYAPKRTALFAGIGAWATVSSVFFIASHLAAKQIDRIAQLQFAGDIVIDRVLTPMPVNPLCWDAILVQSNRREIILRHGRLSLAPSVIPAERCNGLSVTDTTAPLRTIEQSNTPSMRWAGEVATALPTLRELNATHCEAAALLQFARAPWALLQQPSDRWVVGDLRYDREPALGFAEVSIGTAAARCPRHLPPWLPPLDEWLRAH